MHTDASIVLLEDVTAQLGNQFRLFLAETSTIDTVELPREAQKRERDAARKKDSKKAYSGDSQKPCATLPAPSAAVGGGSSSERGASPAALAENLESTLPNLNTPEPNQPQIATASTESRGREQGRGSARGRGRGSARGRGRGSTRGRGRGSTRGRGGNAPRGRGPASQPGRENNPYFEPPPSTIASSVPQPSNPSIEVPIPTDRYPGSCEGSQPDERNEGRQVGARESPAADVAALAPSEGLGVGIPGAVAADVPSGTEMPASTQRRRAKRMNISTIKFHTLGHYPSTIRSLGPTDLYSTEWVSPSLSISRLILTSYHSTIF